MIRLEPIDKLDHIEIDRNGPLELSGDRLREVNDAWLALCDRNPRYFNGTILAYTGYDARSGVIQARVEQYKHHAVRDAIDLGIFMLSVSAMVRAPGERGEDRVYLLGRRSDKNHRYGGLWELGPSGGVEVPDAGGALSMDDLMGELGREVREEVWVEIRGLPVEAVALVHDDAVGSSDIAAVVTLERVPELRLNWEYTDARWMTMDELGAWGRRAPDELIPTTLALARFMLETRG